jgi:hypothetical protein
MSNKKISFGKSYIPEAAGENIDNRLVYDFGKKYAVLEYKFKELKEGALYSAGFTVDQNSPHLVTFTITFYNPSGQVLSTYTVDIPSTPIDNVYLDYEGKKLVIETTNGPDIEADLSELIDKVIALEEQVDELNTTVFTEDVVLRPGDNLTLLSFGEVSGDNVNLGTRGEEENENLSLDLQKTPSFYNKVVMNDKLAVLAYESAVGLDEVAPTEARTWFAPESNIENESLNELVIGFSDIEINDDIDGIEQEFIPGFSDNEVN